MSAEPGDELLGDLGIILRDAIDLIDLSVHNSGLDPLNAYDFVCEEFGRPTADKWLAAHDEMVRDERRLVLVRRAARMRGERP